MAATVQQMSLTITPPGKEGFGGKPYKSAPDLAQLAARVMNKHQLRFTVVQNFEVEYLWKARGGTERNEPKYGDCVMPGGLTKFFAKLDFVIWFAADHLGELSLSDDQYEALMFRQLSKIGTNENTESPLLVGYDFAGFNAELQAYGPWEEQLRKMAHILQPELWAGADEGADDEESADDSDTDEAEEVAAAAASEYPHTVADIEAERGMRARGRSAE